jgi:H+/Cl- antiporter ClcA
MGRLGFAARGIVFLVIGGFLVAAAIHSRASQARGLGGALDALAAQPFGWILLAVTAAGLFAFGAFSMVEARYRHIDAPDLDDAKDAIADGVRNLGS